MGANHAISGAAAWLGAVHIAPTLLHIPQLDPLPTFAGILVCAGAALLPDADHPSATIAHSIPILGKAGANAVSHLAGGHRHGTHSLAILPIVALIAWLLPLGVVTVDWWPQPILVASAISVCACVCFAVKALKLARSWPTAWVVGLGVGAAVAAIPTPTTSAWWVSAALTLGFVVHLAGDFLTVGGLPLLWPWNPTPPEWVRHSPLWCIWLPNGYFALPLLGKTGSMREWALGIALTVTTVALAFSRLIALEGTPPW